MMRFLALFNLVTASLVQADESKMIYQGFGMEVVQNIDSMTDKKSCTLYFDSHPVKIGINGKSQVGIWPATDDMLFAFDGEHLVRIGSSTPKKLEYIRQRKALAAPDAVLAEQIVKALATKKAIKLRVVDWPDYTDHDVEVEEPTFAYVYGVVQKQCGWPVLGLPTTLPPVDLNIYEGEDGYAKVSVKGNWDLDLLKGHNRYGGGCQIQVGIYETVGTKKGQWVAGTNNPKMNATLMVRDKSGKVLFDGKPPAGVSGGNPWAGAEEAARAMWTADPYGTVSFTGLDDSIGDVMLYGFRELWRWGVKNCAFPAFEATP